MGAAIQVEAVSKLYRRLAPGYHLRTLKSALLDGSLTGGLGEDALIPALQEVTFTVAEGESFGVVGSNGSGKSTLLKLLAGILQPSRGRVGVRGRVAALIELGAGFHPEISGRDNIFINGAILGLSRKQVAERFEDIVTFSGLEEFIDEPVKNYSSGMYVRLGFAVAIHTDPDVLLVDEVLAVGDEAFAHKCLRRIEEFLARGKTLVLVSHSLPLIEEYCDRVLWLDQGRARRLGDPREVVDAYRQAVAEGEAQAHKAAKEEREVQETEVAEDEEPVPGEGGMAVAEDSTEERLRWGSGVATIERATLRNEHLQEQYHFRTGEGLVIDLAGTTTEPLRDFVFGVAINTPRGHEVWGTNTHLEGFRSELLDGSWTTRIRCPHLRLAPGEYTLDVAVHSRDGAPYDYRRRLLSLTVTAAYEGVGVYFPEHDWEFGAAVAWERRPGQEGDGREPD